MARNETRYPAGKRPRIRVLAGDFERQGLRGTAVLCRINSRSAYFRSEYVVGEMACNAGDVEIIRHPDGTPVLESEQWPPLTPYDTGERLEPAVWVTPDRRRPEEHDHDRYGRVDFNNDENATEITVWVERGESGGTIVNIDGHSEIERVVVNAMDNSVPPLVDTGADDVDFFDGIIAAAVANVDETTLGASSFAQAVRDAAKVAIQQVAIDRRRVPQIGAQ